MTWDPLSPAKVDPASLRLKVLCSLRGQEQWKVNPWKKHFYDDWEWQPGREVASVRMTARGNQAPARALRDDTTGAEVVAWMQHLAHQHLAPFHLGHSIRLCRSLPRFWICCPAYWDGCSSTQVRCVHTPRHAYASPTPLQAAALQNQAAVVSLIRSGLTPGQRLDAPMAPLNRNGLCAGL